MQANVADSGQTAAPTSFQSLSMWLEPLGDAFKYFSHVLKPRTAASASPLPTVFLCQHSADGLMQLPVDCMHFMPHIWDNVSCATDPFLVDDTSGHWCGRTSAGAIAIQARANK